MKIVGRKVLIIISYIIILIFTCSSKMYAQATGSLFMLPRNVKSQMLNPSYLRTDGAIVFSITGFAGATVGTSSSFKLSNVLYKAEDGTIAFDADKLYKSSGSKNFMNSWLSIPVVFVDIPLSKGRLNFSFKEKVELSSGFNLTEKSFEKGINSPATFTSYYSDNIKLSSVAYQEMAVGYAIQINKSISIGARGKLLFGAALSDMENWNFGIDYTKTGDQIELRHKGIGRIELPVSFYLSGVNRVIAVNSEHAFRNYFGNFKNPGIGIDMGATIKLTEKSWISFSAADIGIIWFKQNTMDINQDTSLIFENSNDIHKYIDYDRKTEGYVDPYDLIISTKDEQSYLYRPRVDTVQASHKIFPKFSLHYQHNLFYNMSFAFTDQLAFYKHSYLNTLTFSTLQKTGYFTFFENINMYGTSNFTFGAGIQWEGKSFQMYAVSDNLQAVFSPAKNKSFSMSVGIAYLLNKPDEPKPKQKRSVKGIGMKRKRSRGKVSPYLPFYKNKH